MLQKRVDAAFDWLKQSIKRGVAELLRDEFLEKAQQIVQSAQGDNLLAARVENKNSNQQGYQFCVGNYSLSQWGRIWGEGPEVRLTKWKTTNSSGKEEDSFVLSMFHHPESEGRTFRPGFDIGEPRYGKQAQELYQCIEAKWQSQIRKAQTLLSNLAASPEIIKTMPWQEAGFAAYRYLFSPLRGPGVPEPQICSYSSVKDGLGIIIGAASFGDTGRTFHKGVVVNLAGNVLALVDGEVVSRVFRQIDQVSSRSAGA